MLGEEISTAGPIHKYSSEQLIFMAIAKVQLEVTIEYGNIFLKVRNQLTHKRLHVLFLLQRRRHLFQNLSILKRCRVVRRIVKHEHRHTDCPAQHL